MNRRMTAVLVGVAVAAVINHFIVGGFGGNIPFNVGRVVISFVAGWLFVSHAHGSLWVAASAGPLVMLIDHVLLKGGYFVWVHFFWPELVQGEGLLAAGGVLISFVMFAPLVAACSWAGGFLARRRVHDVQMHP